MFLNFFIDFFSALTFYILCLLLYRIIIQEPLRNLFDLFYVHIKDAAVTLDGTSGILSSYLNFGQPGRGWDFRTIGRGQVDFEEIIRALNEINYDGPLSVEWEDAAMDREAGAEEAAAFVKDVDFTPSGRLFDEAFSTE